MALALDGSTGATGIAVASASITVSLTTTQPNDVILVATSAEVPSSLSDSAGLTWSANIGPLSGPGGQTLSVYYAIADSALSSDQITAVFAQKYQNVIAIAVSGANTAAPFDTNASIPAKEEGYSASELSFSTDSADAFLFAAFWSAAFPSTPDTGWTMLASGNGAMAEYLIVSSPQSGRQCGATAISGSGWDGFVTAIVAAAVPTILAPRALGADGARMAMTGAGRIASRCVAGGMARASSRAASRLTRWAARRQISYLGR